MYSHVFKPLTLLDLLHVRKITASLLHLPFARWLALWSWNWRSIVRLPGTNTLIYCNDSLHMYHVFFMLQNGRTPGVNPSISDTRSGRCFSVFFTDRRMWSKSQDIWMTDSMKGVQLQLWPWYNMKPVQMSLMRSGTTCAFVCSNPRFCPCCQPLSRLRPLLSSVLI